MHNLRIILLPFSFIYGIITWLRNKLYDWQWLKSYTPSVFTICIGNLSTGGTGKTPHTEYLIKLLKNNHNIAVLSRGYGRKTKRYRLLSDIDNAQSAGDEPIQYFKKFSDIPIAVCEKRTIGIIHLINTFPNLNIVLLDDAYQHRRVNPTLRILLTEYASPFFKDHVLPAGNLREFRNNYKKADFIIVTKTPNNITTTDKEKFIRKIKPLPHQMVFFSSYIYHKTYNFNNSTISIPENTPIMVVTGIANPKPFYQYLNNKFSIVQTITYKDHHIYSTKDLQIIKTIFEKNKEKPQYIITTEKDMMRLSLLKTEIQHLQLPICYIPIEVEIKASNNNEFITSLIQRINQKSG